MFEAITEDELKYFFKAWFVPVLQSVEFWVSWLWFDEEQKMENFIWGTTLSALPLMLLTIS